VRRSRQGYTLFEVILVLALIVLLAALTYPSVDAMSADSKVTAGGDMVRAAWADAQARAIDEGSAYRFFIIPNAGNFRVAPATQSNLAGNQASDEMNHSWTMEGKLPKPIVFATGEGASSGPVDSGIDDSVDTGPGNAAGSWVGVVTFLPDGTARDDAQVRIVGPGCRPLLLRVRGLTGAVVTKRVEANSP